MSCRITEITYQRGIPDLPPAPYCLLHTAQPRDGHRWTILGWDPAVIHYLRAPTDPFAWLDEWLTTTRLPELPESAPPIPRLLGALTYDAGRVAVPEAFTASRTYDPWNRLYGVWLACQQFIVTDHQTETTWQIEWDRPDIVTPSARSSPLHVPVPWPVPPDPRAAFLRDVDHLREHIAAGDCYQVNVARIEHVQTTATAETLFRRLVKANPAPMMGVLNMGAWQMISSSPERLIKKTGNHLVAQPIKGTRPRGLTARADVIERDALEQSEKDCAELAMIVDLLRNDLARIATSGSVAVPEPRQLEAYANVYHAVATITATARAELGWGDLLRAIFPGGSVTGCPKEIAMRLIDRYEPARRGFYCGSLGYIDQHGDGDWNIAIRTMLLQQGCATYHVGCGIVYDSEPAAELAETDAKAASMIEALSGT